MLTVYFPIIFISAGISIAAANVFNDYSNEQNYTGVAYRIINFLPFLLFMLLAVIVVFISVSPQA